MATRSSEASPASRASPQTPSPPLSLLKPPEGSVRGLQRVQAPHHDAKPVPAGTHAETIVLARNRHRCRKVR